jgi:hypothetical protein
MTQRLIEFDNNKNLFLLLNIIGHDPIHDFGTRWLTDDRWKNNRDFAERIKPFLLSSEDNELDDQNKRRKIGGRERNIFEKLFLKNDYDNLSHNEDDSLLIKDDFTKKNVENNNFVKSDIEIKNNSSYDVFNDDLFYTEVKEFISQTQCDIIFTFFQKILDSKIKFKYDSLFNVCYMKLDTEINPLLYRISIKLHDYIFQLIPFEQTSQITIFDAIIDSFFIKIRTASVSIFDDNKTNTEILNELDSSYINIIKLPIFDILTSFFDESYIEFSLFNSLEQKYINGGAKRKRESDIDDDTIVNFVTELDTIIDIQKVNKNILFMQLLFKGYNENDIISNYSNLSYDEISKFKHNDENNIENKNNFEKYKQLLILEFKKIFQDNGINDTKLLNALDTPQFLMKVPRIRTNLIDSIRKGVTMVYSSFFTKRKSIIENIRSIELTNIKNLMKKNSGDLVGNALVSAKKFISFLAKSTLFLSGCCDASGIQTNYIYENTGDFKDILDLEIDILRAVAGKSITDDNKNIDTNDQLWKKTVKNSSTQLDERLFDYIKTNQKDFNLDVPLEGYFTGKNLEVKNPRGPPDYVINNAAIPSGLNKSFCPYSSIIDKMPNCTLSDKLETSGIEFGDMDFKITDNNFFYNGKMDITANEKITLTIATNLPKIRIISSKKLDVRTSKDLKAYIVLRETLIALISKIQDFSESYDIYSEKDIFKKIFEIGVKELTGNIAGNDLNVSSHPDSVFTKVFEQILFKGAGDIFQEINAVTKFGGYTGNNYNKPFQEGDQRKTYKPIDFSTGDTMRCFITKDRVSIARFLFIRNYGKKNQINYESFGGYLGEFPVNNVIMKYKGIQNTVQLGGAINQTMENKIQTMENKIQTLENKNQNDKTKNKKIKILNKKKTRKQNKNVTINITM